MSKMNSRFDAVKVVVGAVLACCVLAMAGAAPAFAESEAP
jgi:hypothetical protein